MKAPKELLGQYIQYYAMNNTPWRKFRDILWLDFSQDFIRDKIHMIEKVYEDQTELATCKRVRYNNVA